MHGGLAASEVDDARLGFIQQLDRKVEFEHRPGRLETLAFDVRVPRTAASLEQCEVSGRGNARAGVPL